MNSFYQWNGINRYGQRVSGAETAINSQKLSETLRNQGIVVLKIKKSLAGMQKNRKKISAKQLAEWTRQVAILTQANVDLVNTLNIVLQEIDNPVLFNTVTQIKNYIENGLSFADALQHFPTYFDKIYCSLIQAGEGSGTLSKMLIQLADYQEQMLALRAKIIKALFYPLSIALAAVLITLGLLMFVVPQFETIFANFGAQLPFFTQMILQVSATVHAHGKKTGLILLIAIISYRTLIRHFSQFSAWRDRFWLKIPLIGPLMTTAIFAQWTRILATLINAGLPLVEALCMANRTVANQSIQTALQDVIHQISAGSSFHQALSRHACFSRSMIQMITIGENAGQLAAMLEKIADSQQQILNRAIDYFSKWLEPAMMMILAIIIGSLIIAMYLPVFKLGAVM